MTDRPDLAALRALAEAATPGPWFQQGQMIHGPDQGGMDIGPLRGEVHIYEEQNARYIRACSPERILALIAEVERLREAAIPPDHPDHPAKQAARDRKVGEEARHAR